MTEIDQHAPATTPSSPLTTPVGRRTFVRGIGIAGGAVMLPGLAACGGDDEADTGGEEGIATGDDIGTVSLGNRYADEVPRAALAAVLEGFEGEADLNTVESNAFQEAINSYLQGTPDDVFSWFAGYRMQFFAERGLSTPISDVWADIESEYTTGFKEASTGLDGEQYFVPFNYYPWAIFYRKSVFEENGYDLPTTADELEDLCKQMESDGLIPFAFADKGGWEAMGTFDYFNLRTNGAEFHRALMRGDESWTDAKVKAAFENFERFLPYHQEGALGRDWQDAAQALVDKSAGMYTLGMFVSQQFPAEDLEDLDFFAFPEVDPEHAQNAVEAPIDGWMLSKDPDNLAGAKALVKYFSTAGAQETYVASDAGAVAANSDADQSNYTALQNKAVELVSAAEDITQFLDRDTRPDFASTVVIPSLQSFISDPSGLDALLESMEQQKQAIFTD